MDRKINKKIESYILEFKDNIKKKAIELDSNNKEISQLIQYIYDYERLILTKEDFMKRKRVKNVVHITDRCLAKRANGEQCTRRRKDDTTEFCGTHLKGTPHGICNFNNNNNEVHEKKVEVWVQDIQGIVYYIDNNNNVYQHEDVIKGTPNPKIIAKYIKKGDVYSIPEFNI